MWLILLKEIVIVPVLKQLVLFGAKGLRNSKKGISKDVGIAMLDAIALNGANNVTEEDTVRLKEML